MPSVSSWLAAACSSETAAVFCMTSLISAISLSVSSRRRCVSCDPETVDSTIASTSFIDAIGFDPLVASLEDSRLLEPGGPVFGIELSAEEMIAALAEAGGRAERYQQQ